MSLGSWILAAFSARHRSGRGGRARPDDRRAAAAGPAAVRAAGGRGPGRRSRRRCFAAPLAVYTAVLLADTATPTWNAAQRELPFVFVSSAAPGRGRPGDDHHPGRPRPGRPGGWPSLGVVGDLLATQVMEHRMDPVAAEPLHARQGRAVAALERGARRRRRARAAARRAPPRSPRPVRPGAAGGVGADPVRCLRGGHALGPRPALHRSNRRSAGWPPAGRPASPTTRSPPSTNPRAE